MSRRLAPLASWEFGVLVFMALLYALGTGINPDFFGNADALLAVLRDAARFGIMAVGMTYVIVNRDLDLSVGSTVGLTATVFSMTFAPVGQDGPLWLAVLLTLAVGLAVGLVNGVLVTKLKVPAFIATLTMLLIGRGFVLALTSGRAIGYAGKAEGYGFFWLGENNALGLNNQILIFLLVALLGGVVLARTRWGYQTYATGGNLQAAGFAGIDTDRVRIRAFVISSLCATLAGLLNVAQDKGVTSQYGLGAELIVIAAVIVGGTSILGGRGRVLGSCLGAVLIVLIDKVLREGVPVTRTMEIGGQLYEVQAMAQLPPGAVPAFLGLILLISVLIEPWLIRSGLIRRLFARLRGAPTPPLTLDSVAIEAPRTGGTRLAASEVNARGWQRLMAYRETAAVGIMLVLWAVGMYLRPDFWGNLDNTFNLLLAFTEIGIMAVGMAYVIGNGDIDLSVGSVLALSGATAAFLMKSLDTAPWLAALIGLGAGTVAGIINGLLVTTARLPAFIATLGMFYMARGVAAWLTAGRQLNQFPESYNLLGRKLIHSLESWGMAPVENSWLHDLVSALSTQTLILAVLALVFGVILWRSPLGYRVKATGGNRRAAEYAGINTDRVRFASLLLSALCASLAGLVYIAFFRSFNPVAGQLRELDVIAAVIIGGGSLFGGYGSVLGALAGAAVITLIRAILSLQVISSSGESFVMPQHWVNVCIGLVLISAVLMDIWLRQEGLLARLRRRPAPATPPPALETAP